MSMHPVQWYKDCIKHSNEYVETLKKQRDELTRKIDKITGENECLQRQIFEAVKQRKSEFNSDKFMKKQLTEPKQEQRR